ncbi:MAG: hypothetical protein Q7R76_05710 [Candidatus Woesearchaeota archaeon]|nr:hypothetical protein [Candidatus Woesearchaeota archaeon]
MLYGPSGGTFFERGVLALEQLGISDVLLPFILIFTIVFAIAHRSKMFGENRKNIEVIISLVMAFSVIIPHVTGDYPGQWDVVNIINSALPNVSLVIVLILMALLLIGLTGHHVTLTGSSTSGLIVLVAFIVVGYIFGAAANLWSINDKLSFLNNPDTQALVVVVLVFGMIVYFITKEDKVQGEKWLEQIGKHFTKSR